MIAVCEVFDSIQGEGMTMGRPSVFLRLAGCNLMCGGKGTQHDGKLHDGATWRCDTIELWMHGRAREYSEVFEADHLAKLKAGAHLVITGGEPILQERQIRELKKRLALDGISPFTEVETNGTIMPDHHLYDQFNVSPKLGNSGMPPETRYKKEVLEHLSTLHSQFKFVVSHEEDWEEIARDFSFIPKQKIWLMPAGDNQEELSKTRRVAVELAQRNGVNYSDRLQIVIWNEKTGV